jgi:hypothetical protein
MIEGRLFQSTQHEDTQNLPWLEDAVVMMTNLSAKPCFNLNG